MKPLNSSLRSLIFLRFLLFYITSLGLIMLLVYLGFRIPAMQYKQLKAQAAAYEKQRQYASSFNLLLSAFSTYQQQALLTGQDGTQIKQAMIGMQTYADNDSVTQKSFYTDVLRLLTAVQANNQQIKITKSKLQYLQTMTLQSARLDADLVKVHKVVPAPKATAQIKKPEVKAIDYDGKMLAMLDSVIKYKKPSIESFNPYLCSGVNTPVLVNKEKPHPFKDLYKELTKHKKSIVTEVKTEIDKGCVKQLTIKWKNSAFLGSSKLF